MTHTPIHAAHLPPLFDLHTHQKRRSPGVVCIFQKWLMDEAVGDWLPCSIGLHPWQLDKMDINTMLIALESAALPPQTLAIGECGLDKACATPMEVQAHAFRWQLSLAERLQKPVIIHCVRAFEEVLDMLGEQRVTVPVVFHGYRKGRHLAQRILSDGHWLSFGRHLIQPRVAEVFRSIPLERVFLETDDGLTPLGQVYAAAAAAKGLEYSFLVGQLWANAQSVFGESIVSYG